MNIKQMLMASTAVLALGATAAPVAAQTAQPELKVAQAAPPALMSAIQTYREAEAAVAEAEASGGDVASAQAALDTAGAELTELCAAVGQNDIQACLALFEGGGTPAAEPEAPAEEEAAPAEEMEEAAPEQAPEQQPEAAEEPAPEEAAEPAPEPEPEQAAPEEPEAAPEAAEEPQADAEGDAAAAEEPQMQEEAAPEEPAQQEPVAEEPQEDEAAPAPEAEEEAAPASEAPQSLLDALEAYRTASNEYYAALESDGDVEAAIENLGAAEAELRSICEALGQTDLAACLAQFGTEVELVDPEAPPAAGESGAAEDGEAADVTDEAADAVEGDEETVVPPPAPEPEPEPELQDDIVLEDGDQGEIVPEGVNAEEVAPLLDSEKDSAAEAARGENEAEDQGEAAEGEEPVDADAQAEAEADVEADAEAETEQQAEAEEPQQAPSSDEEAQSQVEVVLDQIESITSEEGQRREASAEVTASGEPELVGRVENERFSNVDIITTIGLATVFAIGANQFIDSPDTPRIIEDNYDDYYVEDLPRGRTREVIVRPDGSQLVTVRDRYGDIIRRSRIEPDGREILLVYVDPDYRRYDEQGRWIDPGRELPPLRLNIPPREYVLDASYADEQRVAQFLDQPPVESIRRYYTLDEVKRSSRVRDMVRRLEVGDLTFDTGSATIPQQELNALSAVANAMLDLLQTNPAETFLIEGHTDAVGSDLNNLELSDRRAESVAYALTRVYGIPPENLATQGYGERYLKVNTQTDERINRRVTIRRITPLITPVASN